MLAHVWTGGGVASSRGADGRRRAGARPAAAHAGELWAYSIESREPLVRAPTCAGTWSCTPPTPHARRTRSAGSPSSSSLPGAELRARVGARLVRHPPPRSSPPSAARRARRARRRSGRPDRVPSPATRACVLRAPRGIEVAAAASCAAPQEGETYVEIEDGRPPSRVAVSWHAPLEEIVRRRVRFILDHQRAATGRRAGRRRAAAVRHESGSPVLAARLGRLLRRSRADRDGAAAPAGAAPAVGSTTATTAAERGGATGGSCRGASSRPTTSARGLAPARRERRLYDVPWLRSCCSAAQDVERAKDDVARYYRRRGRASSRSGSAIAARELAPSYARRGDGDADEVAGLHRATRGARPRRASCPRTRSTTSSRWSRRCSRSSAAARTTGDEGLDDEIAARLPWLLAFGGPQPHVRLRDIAIRHWDGYWFGREQLWGDTFPHHWSALTANVLLMLPAAPCAAAVERERGESAEAMAARIYAANLIDFAPDGTATAAFVMPELRLGPRRAPRRPAGQRPGLGALLAAPARRLFNALTPSTPVSGARSPARNAASSALKRDGPLEHREVARVVEHLAPARCRRSAARTRARRRAGRACRCGPTRPASGISISRQPVAEAVGEQRLQRRHEARRAGAARQLVGQLRARASPGSARPAAARAGASAGA